MDNPIHAPDIRKTMNAVTLRHHRGIPAPNKAVEGETPVERLYVCSANMKLAQYGYSMTKELFEACLQTTHEQFLSFFSELFDIISKDAAAISLTGPIWPNFPNDAMNASLADLYVVNLLHYLTHGFWAPAFDPKLVCPELDEHCILNLKQIPMCDEEEIYRYAVQCLTANTPMSPSDSQELFFLMEMDWEFLRGVMNRMQDKTIPIRENLAMYASKIMTSSVLVRNGTLDSATARQFHLSTDVLRLAVALSGGDVSLATTGKFRSFTRQERKTLLRLLEQSDLEEGVAQRPEQFKRLGERIHPGEYGLQFPKTNEVFRKVRNGIRIETYNSLLQEYMKPPVDVDRLTAHLMLRPGMFARTLDFCLRSCQSDTQRDNVLYRFISVCDSVDTRVLLQLINHFRNYDNEVKLYVGKANGAAAKVQVKDDASEGSRIPEDYCRRAAKDISNQLWRILRAGDTCSHRVYIDPKDHCNDLVFPSNPRQISSGGHTLARGSRMALPAGNVIRPFLYWKGKDKDDYWDGGIDLDLSVVFLKSLDEIAAESPHILAYHSPCDYDIKAIHSGDRRQSGPNGAVEYVDFDVSACLENGYRYAIVCVHSYSNHKFSEMENAFCGVMIRDGETGEQFDPRTVQERFDLTSEAKALIGVVIDLYSRTIISVDTAIAGGARASSYSSLSEIINVARAAKQDDSLSIKDMLGMRFEVFTKDWHEADCIVTSEPNQFTSEKGTDTSLGKKLIVSPYDVPGIWGVVMGNTLRETR